MNLAVAEHGEYVAVREMRKHIGWYLKGLKNSARYRDQINKITDYKEVISMLEELYATLLDINRIVTYNIPHKSI